MGYELKETESLLADEYKYAEKTMQMHCDHCKGDAFEVFLEGNVVYYMCKVCKQVIEVEL